jgi:hypothetical protein
MEKHNRLGRRTRIDVGFAADALGNGIACAQLVEGGRERELRVPFRLRRMPALLGRDVAYAALTAVADEARRQGVAEAEFVVADERLELDLELRRSLPGALSLPYVRLRCALNRFRSACVHFRDGSETAGLTESARCEIGLLAAA